LGTNPFRVLTIFFFLGPWISFFLPSFFNRQHWYPQNTFPGSHGNGRVPSWSPPLFTRQTFFLFFFGSMRLRRFSFWALPVFTIFNPFPRGALPNPRLLGPFPPLPHLSSARGGSGCPTFWPQLRWTNPSLELGVPFWLFLTYGLFVHVQWLSWFFISSSGAFSVGPFPFGSKTVFHDSIDFFRVGLFFFPYLPLAFLPV